MRRLVRRLQEEGDLVDAEQRIGVEDECNSELAPGEFRIVERCPTSVGGFPVTATTPDLVGTIKRLKYFCIAIWAGSCCPDSLESPLDDRVEWLQANSIAPS